MADLDRLDITSGIDTTGLDRGLAQELAALDRFASQLSSRQLPALTLDTSRISSDLAKAGASVDQFFAGFQGGVSAREVLGGIADELAVTASRFQANSVEARAFQTEIGRLRQLEQQSAGSTLQLQPTGPVGDAGQAARLAQAVQQEADAAAQAALAVDRLTAADAQQAIAALKSGAAAELAARQIQDQGRAALLASQQTAEAQRLAAASPPTGPTGPLTPPSGIRELIAQQEALTLTSRGIPAALSRTSAAFNEAGVQAGVLSRGIRDVVAGNEKMAAGIALASGTVERGTHAFSEHSIGAYRATQAVASLAATTLGAEGPVARLAESALLFGGGELAVVAVASGVLALGAAYRFVSSAQREVEEGQAKLIQGLLTEASSAIPAAVRAQDALTAALLAQQKAREGTTLRDVGRALLPVAQLVADPTGTFSGEFARRQAAAQVTSAKAVEQAQRDQLQTVKDFQSVNVAVLTESISLHAADAEHIARAQALVSELRRQEELGNVPPAEHNRLLRERLGLESALRDEALQAAQKAGAQQGITDDLAATQQGLSARQDAVKASFDQELITRRQFYAQRRDLAVAAERADVQALQQRLSETTSKPGQTPAAQLALDTEAQHLRAQITLRESILGQQLAQIRNEETLAKIGVQQRVPAPVPPVFLDLPKVDTRATVLGLAEIEAHIKTMNAEAAQGTLDDEIERARRAAEALNPLLTGIGLSLKDIGNANISAPADSSDAQVAKVAGGLHRITGALQEVGVLSQQAAKDLGDVVDLGAAIATGDVAGIVSGGIKIIGDIFGKSQTEKDLEQAQRENTRALADATKAYQISQGGFQGAGGIAQQQRIVGSVLESPAGQKAFRDVNLGELEAAALAAGTSLTEMRNIAHDYGITLVRDHHLVAESGERLAKAMDLAAQAAGSLGTTISDQQRTAETRDTLGLPSTTTGVTHSTDPNVARLERARDLELNNLNLSAQEEARIRALDLSTAEGRKAFLEEQRVLEQRIESGAFKPGGELGPQGLHNFQNVTELQGVIDEAGHGLRAFTDAVTSATKALSNVPDLFTLSEQEFRARSAFSTSQGPNDGAQLPIVGHPTPLERPSIEIPAPGISTSRASLDSAKVTDPIVAGLTQLSGGATLKDLLAALQPTGTPSPAATPTQGRTLQFFAPITIVVPDAKDPDATARAVVARLQSIDLATTGRED